MLTAVPKQALELQGLIVAQIYRSRCPFEDQHLLGGIGIVPPCRWRQT
jgi:hypothetical protein